MKIDWKRERADQSGILAKVYPTENGWNVESDSSTGFSVENTHCTTPPEVGESFLLVGDFGFPIRGIEIGGRCYRYRTEAEEAERHRAYVADEEYKRKIEADDHRAERDAKVAAMPPFFQERIERFRRVRSNFRRDHEPYEIFTCEQAVLFAETLKTVEALRAFAEAPYEDQKKMVPELSNEHSGNTFHMALKLAHLSLEKPELLPKMHGALCALVGCKGYGCYAAVGMEAS